MWPVRSAAKLSWAGHDATRLLHQKPPRRKPRHSMPGRRRGPRLCDTVRAVILTYRYRVKDASKATRRALRSQARSVNFLWNYCCQVDREAQRRWKAGAAVKRPRAFDLANLCRGVTKDLGIHSDTVDAVCRKFCDARDACFPRTPRLRSFKNNLDFVPFSNFKRPAKLEGGKLTVLGRSYYLWLSRQVPDNGKPKSWEFSTDARGRWYVNIQVELPEPEKRNAPRLGIDLGLKSVVALSNVMPVV